jgi:hypothetical protein
MSPLTLVGEDIVEERGEQIVALIDELISYSVVLKDLTYIEAPYNIRNELVNIALYIVSNVELYEEFIEKKELPISKIMKAIAKPRKFIEKYKEYIITYLIVLGNPSYKLIQDYLRVAEENKKLDNSSNIIAFSENDNTRGMVLAKNKRDAIVMTSIGEFKRIRIVEDAAVGEEIEGYKRKSLKDYKMQVSLLSILIIITLILGVYNYNKTATTVVVDSFSTVKLDVNFLGRVVRVSLDKSISSESIGKDQILDRDLDTVLYKIIKYYYENDMLLSNKVIVTISGKSIEYGVLKETQKYVKEKSIDIRINNNGMEQKLY